MLTFEVENIETSILHDNGVFNATFILDKWEQGEDHVATDDYADYEAVLKESPEVMTGEGFMEKYASVIKGYGYESFSTFVYAEGGRSGNTYNHADLDITNKNWIQFKILDTPFLAFRLHKYGDVRGNYTQWYIVEDVDDYGVMEILHSGYISGFITFTDGTEATLTARQNSDVYYWKVYEADSEGQAERFEELAKHFDRWEFDEVIFDLLLHGSYETDKLDPLTDEDKQLHIARNNPNQKELI